MDIVCCNSKGSQDTGVELALELKEGYYTAPPEPEPMAVSDEVHRYALLNVFMPFTDHPR